MAMDDMYSDDPTDRDSSEERSESMEDSDEETSLLPKSLFPGKDCKPGDMLKVKVVAVHESEVEVKGTGYDKKEKDSRRDPRDDSDEDDSESMFV